MKDTPSIKHSRVDAPRYVVAVLPDCPQQHTTDLLVIGSGAAGLAAALCAAEHADVIVLARDSWRETNSARAQGGIAAALDAADSPRLHVEDTLIAGAGLCDPAAVEALAAEAPALMRELAMLGVPFARTDDRFALGLEGGHSQRRIVHVGDATGWALTRALAARARACPKIRILEGYQAVDLTDDGGECSGALALDRADGWHHFRARATILATGGAGALYGLTSNQPGALGEGIALAYRAGAAVADMEFIQFHPTVLRSHTGQGFLITEAVRGEGAQLLTPSGRRFMHDYDPRAELAPRDIVARGIFAAMRREGSDHVLLDLTHLPAEAIERRFPTITARCRAERIDPARDPIPVAPAAHYLMGGICTDLHGATSIPRLYAAGECACTGVHGANRLASNSLLECLVFGRRAATAALEDSARASSEMRDWRLKIGISTTDRSRISHLRSPTAWRGDLADLMRAQAGLVRLAAGLATALRGLDTLPDQAKSTTPNAIIAANAALVARLIVASAFLREESRGAHYRIDFPQTDDTWQVHLVLARGQPAYTVERVVDAAQRVLLTNSP